MASLLQANQFQKISKSSQAMIHRLQATRPNLSSINHPLYDLGAVSMRMLTKIMHKEELEDKDVILNHGLTLRQSTK